MAYDIQALRQKYNVGTPAAPASQTPVQATGAPSTTPAPDIQALRQKYNVVPPLPDTTAASTPQGSVLGTAAKITDAVFGSGKVGDLIGATGVQSDLAKNPQGFMPAAQAANLKDVYTNLSPEAKARLEAKGLPTTLEGNAQNSAQIASKNVPLPSGKELLGSLGQTALLATPEGDIVDALGGGKIAKTLAGAATGYGYDVAQNLQSNKDGAGIFKPGLGTALGAATPLALAGGKALIGSAKPATAVAGSLAEGAGNILTAPFRFIGDKLKNATEVAALPEAERGLAKSGFSDPARTFLTTATPETKNAFGQMIDAAEKGSTDLRSRVQPKEVVGKEFLKPVDAIAQDAKKAGQTIQQEAMKPGKVDIGNIVQDFRDKLESKGVLARKDGTLVSTGRVPRSDLKYYEDVLNEVKDVTGGKSSIPRSQAHALRQRLYDTLDAATKAGGQPGTKPFSSLVDNDVNSLRASIADSMGEKYKDAAKQYAVNQSALSNVAKFAGVPTKIENISSKSLKLGEGLMRALGNASDKPTSLINEITDLAKQRGYKSNVNLHDLIDFADNLEDLYGIKQTRSFEGGIRRGTEQAMPSLPKTPTELVMKAAQAATKQSNQDKINALKKFLGK